MKISTKYLVDIAWLEKIHVLLMDFDFKRQWNKGIGKIDYNKNKTNRIGTSHTYTVQDRDLYFETMTNEF